MSGGVRWVVGVGAGLEDSRDKRKKKRKKKIRRLN